LDNESIVRKIYADFGSGDHDAAFAAFADDVEWAMQESTLPAMYSSLGRDEMRRWFSDITSLLEVTALHHVDFITDGDHVVVYGDATRRGITTHFEETSGFLNWYTLRDGQVTRSQQFLDTLSHAPVLLAEAAAQGRDAEKLSAAETLVASTTREKLSSVAQSLGSLPRGSAEDSVQLIRRWYSYHGRGDLDRALGLMDEQVETHHPGAPALYWAGTRRGRDEVRAAITSFPVDTELSISQPFTILVRDHHVVSFGERRITHRPSGRTALFDWATVFEIQAGLIRRMLHFTDTLAFASVLGIAPQSPLKPPAQPEQTVIPALGPDSMPPA
jgi:ketosteroid isomerase-like protein